MKKLILVMVFVLLTALFIAFNYLLLERENRENDIKSLEFANANNTANINAQKREIESLNEENRKQRERIDQLVTEKDQLNQENVSLNSEKENINETLQERINFINTLKQYADIKVLSEPVTKWVEALNQGKYEEAYALEFTAVPLKDRKVTLAAYSENAKNTIRKIELTEVKVDKLRGSGNGDIYLEVRLGVKLVEGANASTARFSEGENSIYVKIGYSNEDKVFIITGITNA